MKKTAFQTQETPSLNGWRDHGTHQMQYGSQTHVASLYTKGGCKVLVSHEDHGKGRMRWHLSISREDRYPGWNEIKDARYSLMPDDITVAQILPPAAEFVNIHSNCFHLWEIDHHEW